MSIPPNSAPSPKDAPSAAAFSTTAELHTWLLGYRDPVTAIGEERWSDWVRDAVQRCGQDTRIESLAVTLGLKWPRTRAEQILADLSGVELHRLARTHGLGRTKLATLIAAVAFASGAYAQDEPTVTQPPSQDETAPVLSDRLLTSLLGILTPRETEVVTKRFGLRGCKRLTLEAIAADHAFQVTRERVRQIEQKALRKLRLCHYEELQRALQQDVNGIWTDLTQGAPVLIRNQLSDAESRVAPVRLLAVALVHRKLSRWLEQYATRFMDGWYIAPVSIADIRSLTKQLLKILADRCEPVMFSTLCRTVDSDPSAVHVAIECNPGLSNIRGYVYKGPPTRRRRRRARLHALLTQRHPPECLPGFVVAQQYASAFPDDHCSIRDVELVMQDSPHLFLRCAEEGWVGLAACNASAEATPEWLISSDTPESRALEEKEKSDFILVDTPATTLNEFIRVTLVKTGPLHISKILTLCVARFGDNHPASSIPAVIFQGNYVRLAPGVWGLPHHVPLVSNSNYSSSLLLSERDCRMYTRSRHAGEPANAYPMWTPAMEYQWAIWALENASADLLSSFLFVAEPDTWPVRELIRHEWQNVRRERARYRLRDPLNYHLAESLPSLKNLLTIAVVSAIRGHISWVSANRVVGRRIDSHRSATSLAILIELGLVEAAEHWQESHRTTSACGQFVDLLATTLRNTGTLEWNSDVGREVATRIERSGHAPHDSWAPDLERLALRTALSGPGFTFASGVDDGLEEPDPGLADLNPDLQRFLDEA